MVTGVKLVGEPTDKTYYFKVPAAFECGMRGRGFKYVIVDTAKGLKIGKVVGVIEGEVAPDDARTIPTKRMITPLSESAFNDYYKPKQIDTLKSELQNKIANMFYILSAEDSHGHNISVEAKVMALVILATTACDPEITARVQEITDLYRELNNAEKA